MDTKNTADVFTFAKPFSFEGQEYESIKLDLESLTGEDMIAAEREFTAGGNFTAMTEMNKQYLSIIAAKAAKLPNEFMRRLPAKEFSKVTVLVQNFLLG